MAYRELAGLAILAGLDWVTFEGNHLHVSGRGAHATISTDEMIKTLDWGWNTGDPVVPRLILSQRLYTDLRYLMVTAQDNVRRGHIAQAKKTISAFNEQEKVGVANGKIIRGFARGRNPRTGLYTGTLEKGLLQADLQALQQSGESQLLERLAQRFIH